MATARDGASALPTLGWVENGAFHALPTVFLQSLMDIPVPIMKEFDPNWPRHWTALVWADRRRLFRLEHMVERDGIVEAFDIDPTLAPNYTSSTTYFILDNVTDIRYSGWTDETHLFVLHWGVAAAHFDINYTSLEELNGVIYDIYARTTRSNAEFADGVA
ncbi:hypothetical protein Cgig2_006942 [Carnegiea gigantea]|uniref:Uncharacterized protein n=1 Tax=Carnegiea gigantea TaxID=171969 RepID=A0A9Q1KD10_9CARY|nr:hypothetical protein Cgig2_006942 [Carnegiea gigantea]